MIEPHEHYEYATVTDCMSNTARVATVEEELYTLRQICDRVDGACISAGMSVRERLDSFEYKIDSIREALIDIQDTLRRLGMDDMSERLGDLKVLLG